MKIRRGMRVFDLGCRLAQMSRARAGLQPKVVTVLRIFPWGLRVVDDGQVYDSEHFAVAIARRTR